MTVVGCGGPGVVACTDPDGGMDGQVGIGGSAAIDYLRECDLEGFDAGTIESYVIFFPTPHSEDSRLTTASYGLRWSDVVASFPEVPEDDCAQLPEATNGPPDGLDAGAGLTLSGPRGTSTLDRWGGPYNDYGYIGVDDGSRFVPGARYTLSGSGSTDVGIFEAAVQAPSEFVVTQPDITDACCLHASRDQDLQLRWTAEDGEDRLVFALVVGETFEGGWLCKFRNTGTARIPASVLSNLPSDFQLEVFTYRAFAFSVPCIQGPIVGMFDIAWWYIVSSAC
jgi:hypothetical protein